MKNHLIFLFCQFCFLTATAQVITIKDKNNNTPLEFATVFDVKTYKNTTTNSKGQADITFLKGSDSISVSLLGYKSTVFSFNQLRERNYLVLLEPSNLSLDEVEISAVRWQQERKDSPVKITRIHRRDAFLQNPQTAADLLSISGNVFVQKSQQGGGSPMIRGFATNRVLLTVDGVRMNNAIFRSGNIQNVISLDPLAIEKTEVLFGPGAVMYGSDAIGGAMNFYTLNPVLSGDSMVLVKINALARYSSANNENTGHFDLNLGYKKWAFISSASVNNFGDLKTGSHGPTEFLRPEFASRINDRDTILPNPDPRVQIGTAYKQFNLMQKIRFVPNAKWDIQYGTHYSKTSDIPRYDRLIEYRNGILRDAEWFYGPQEWLMNNLNISHYQSKLLYHKAKLTLAQQYFGESRHNRSFGSNERFNRKEQVNAYSLNMDFDKRTGTNNSLNYGAEWVSNFIGSFANLENINTQSISPVNTRYPNGSQWHSMGAYLSYLHRFEEKTILQSGARYSHILLHAPFDTTIFPFPFTEAGINTGALTGSIGLGYKPSKHWQLNANLSTGFRAPNIDDIGKVFDSEPGAVIVPNPGLKPEYAYNAELGISRVIKLAKIDLTGFYTFLQDALVRREFSINGQDSIVYEGRNSQVLAIQNAASAIVYGIQTSIEIKLPGGFALSSKFTYQQGKEELDEGGTAPLRHAVPWFGVTRLSYALNRLRADINVQYQSGVAFEQLPPSEKAKPQLYAMDSEGKPYSPQWATWNFKMSYQLTEKLLVNAGIENILDTRYRPFTSGLAAPGRNFVVSMRAAF